MANGNGDGDWKVWGIRLGFGVIAALLPITVALAALSYSNLKGELKADVGRIETLISKHMEAEITIAAKQEHRFDELCKQVGNHGALLREHDTLLRLPWNQRKEFYLLPKSHTDKILP